MAERVLVFGGRTYGVVDRDAKDQHRARIKATAERDLLWKTLDQIHRERGIAIIIHGAAPGADSEGEKWARQNEVAYLGIPAQWRKFEAMGKVRAAGHARNRRLIPEGQPTLAVECKGGTGTAGMRELVVTAAIERIVVPGVAL